MLYPIELRLLCRMDNRAGLPRKVKPDFLNIRHTDRFRFMSSRILFPLALALLAVQTMSPGLLPLLNATDRKVDVSKIHGRIQFVTSFPDYKVKVVQSFPDLRVETVESFPDRTGRWQIVDSFPDYKIQLVDSFPDFTIQFVDAFPGTR